MNTDLLNVGKKMGVDYLVSENITKTKFDLTRNAIVYGVKEYFVNAAIRPYIKSSMIINDLEEFSLNVASKILLEYVYAYGMENGVVDLKTELKKSVLVEGSVEAVNKLMNKK